MKNTQKSSIKALQALDYVASQRADAAYDSLQQSLAAGDSEAAAIHQADYEHHSEIRDIARDSARSSEQALFDIKKESAQKILDTFDITSSWKLLVNTVDPWGMRMIQVDQREVNLMLGMAVISEMKTGTRRII